MNPPVRPCCGQPHTGPVCPDGKVMCCLCFDRFDLREMSVENGKPTDVCLYCSDKKQMMTAPNGPNLITCYCLLTSHDIDWDNIWTDDHTCRRCGQTVTGDAAWGITAHVSYWWRVKRPLWLRPARFFSKCQDCGKRFGRHDDDCLPF